MQLLIVNIKTGESRRSFSQYKSQKAAIQAANGFKALKPPNDTFRDCVFFPIKWKVKKVK
jgi:hypothetical protein